MMLFTKQQFLIAMEAVERCKKTGQDQDGKMLQFVVETVGKDCSDKIDAYLNRKEDHVILRDETGEDHRIESLEDLYDFLAIFNDRRCVLVADFISHNLAELNLDWLPEEPRGIGKFITRNINETIERTEKADDIRYRKIAKQLHVLKDQLGDGSVWLYDIQRKLDTGEGSILQRKYWQDCIDRNNGKQ